METWQVISSPYSIHPVYLLCSPTASRSHHGNQSMVWAELSSPPGLLLIHLKRRGKEEKAVISYSLTDLLQKEKRREVEIAAYLNDKHELSFGCSGVW